MSTTNIALRHRRFGSDTHPRWVKDTGGLMTQLKEWASRAGWSSAEEERTLTEDAVGTYYVRVFTIKTPEGDLTAEPIALRTPELNGRVDLCAYPSLARVLLLRDARGADPVWKARTSDGLDWPLPWDRETFHQIARGLLRVR